MYWSSDGCSSDLGAARRVLAVLSGLDLDPGDATVVASGPADVAGDVDGVMAGGRNRLPALTIPCIDAGRSNGDAARPAPHAGDTGPVAGRCRSRHHVESEISRRFRRELVRSEERCVGEGGVSTGRSRWAPYH